MGAQRLGLILRATKRGLGREVAGAERGGLVVTVAEGGALCGEGWVMISLGLNVGRVYGAELGRTKSLGLRSGRGVAGAKRGHEGVGVEWGVRFCN